MIENPAQSQFLELLSWIGHCYTSQRANQRGKCSRGTARTAAQNAVLNARNIVSTKDIIPERSFTAAQEEEVGLIDAAKMHNARNIMSIAFCRFQIKCLIPDGIVCEFTVQFNTATAAMFVTEC